MLNSCKKEEAVSQEQITTFTITSEYTGSDYEIAVVLPEDYNPEIKYETVYVLDGMSMYLNYKDIAGICADKSAENGKQNAIVVGIGGLEYRTRDFTPSQIEGYADAGGSENYSKFLESELIPKIESDFSTDTTAGSRVIIGHSLGGLLTGYLFTEHPQLFKNYLTLSPSIWWDDGVLLDLESETRESNSTGSSLVYIGSGEFEEGIVIFAKEWNYRLSTFYPGCKVEYNNLRNLSHVSSALKNATYGIEFYYKNK